MRRHLHARRLAFPVVAAFVVVAVFAVLRRSDADTPNSQPAADGAVADEAGDQGEPRNRIRFPSPPPPEFAQRPAVAGGYRDYPVRQAAAETPVGDIPPAARITGTPTPAPPREAFDAPRTSGPSASPYGGSFATGSPPAAPPFAGSPTAAAPMAPTTATPLMASAASRAPRELPPAATPPSPAAAAPQSLRTTAAPNVASGGEGTGRPGEKALEGAQTPTLAIEKIAPAEIQIGKPALFEIRVRNAGATAAHDVEIHDVVPQGTQFVNSKPTAGRGPRGEIVWSLGTLNPGDEAAVQLELMPTSEGEIGSIAVVRFAASASVRTICTRPELAIDVQAPRSVMAGDDVPLHIRVTNPGTGVATGIVLTEVVPAGLEHEAGGELEYEVGDLQPNESRELDLTLHAVRPGATVNLLHAKGDGRLATEVKTQIEVVAPALAVEIEGPKRRYLDRQATYVVSIANPGTAAAREVELATYLPRGMQFVEADNQGEYDPQSHSVRWLLEELPPRERGSVTLTALPVEPGRQMLRIESSADRGVTARKEESILVEAAASIVFQVADLADPIEVGGETTYEITVANQGSKEATNVQLSVTLDDPLKPLDAEGPTRFAITGKQVQFQPIAQIPAKSETKFRIRVMGQVAGDYRCHVQLVSDDMKTPILKEEGTRVYADE